MKDAPRDMLPLGGVQVQSITSASAHSRISQTRKSGPLPESRIKQSDFSLGSTSTPEHSFIGAHATEPCEAPPTERSQLSLLNRPMDEMDDRDAGNCVDFVEDVFEPTSLVPPVKTSQSDEKFSPPRFVLSTPAPEIGAERNRQEPLSARQFVLSDSQPAAPSNSQPATPSNLQPAAPSNPQQLRQAPLRETEAYRPTPAPRRSENITTESGRTERRFSTRMQGLISMSAPILATLVVVMGLSYCARLSPQSIDTLISYGTPSFIRESTQTLPPSALGVKNLRLSFKKTRNKEVVAIVSGTVSNESSKKFDDVELEVLGFNERGQIIASSRAPLRSALANEKIAELSLDAVKRFQTALAAKDRSITGREAVPFAAALLDGRQLQGDSDNADVDPSQVRYFSARIFSIKKPS